MSESGAPSLAPLRCGACGSVVALGAADSLACAHCGATIEVPPAHRALREARLEYDGARPEALALMRRMAHAPGALLRFLTEAFSPIALACGAFPAMFLVAFAPLMGGMSLLGPLLSRNLFDVIPNDQQLWLAVYVGLAMAWVGAFLGARGSRRALAVGGLQAALAARPPTTPASTWECRICGAPLEVRHGELHATCDYCRADNLVALPAAWVERMKSQRVELGRAFEDARARWDDELASVRRFTMRLGLGLIVPTVLMLLGFASSIVPTSTDPRRETHDFTAHVRATPRTFLERHYVEQGGLDYLLDEIHPIASRCDEAEESVELVSGTRECNATACRHVIYVALERGEIVRIWSSRFAFGSRAVAHQHVGLAWEADDGWRSERASFGRRISLEAPRPDAPLTLGASVSAWHRFEMHVVGSRAHEPFYVCLTVGRGP